MSKPKIPPTSYGYSLWKEYSLKDVHVQYFAYNFKDIDITDIKDQEESDTDRSREVRKFAYDTVKKELSVTFSGHMQSRVVDILLKWMKDSVKKVPVDDEAPRFHTNTVTKLFQNPGDTQEKYRILGDVLVVARSGPVFAIETATRHSYPSIKEKVKKWFLLPSMAGVLVVHLIEGNGYWRPTSRPRDSDVFLINSWAWLNYIVDLNDKKIDLFDCSKPVIYDEHMWLGSLTCSLELYEPTFTSKSAQCTVTKRYEFVVPNRGFSLEVTEELQAFQQRLTEIWNEAIDGESLPGSEPVAFNWKQLARCVAKGRLQLAYERYEAWFKKYSKPITSSTVLGKRPRQEMGTQEVFYATHPDSHYTSYLHHLHQ